jgi:hypothetical protein
MLMLDVRNAIARILDRYFLSDVVDITLRKMRRDNVPIPFEITPELAPVGPQQNIYREEGHPLGSFLQELEDLGAVGHQEVPKAPMVTAAPRRAMARK